MPDEVKDQVEDNELDTAIAEPEAKPEVEATPASRPAPAPSEKTPSIEDRLKALEAELGATKGKLSDAEEEAKFYREEAERVYQGEPARRPAAEPSRGEVNPLDQALTPDETDLKDIMTNPRDAMLKNNRRVAGVVTNLIFGTISRAVQQQQYAQTLRTTFYRDHEDLVGFEEIVATAADRVEAAHPRLPKEKLLPRIADEARARIEKIRSGKSDTSARGRGPTSFAGSRTTPAPAKPKPPEGKQAEIASMAPELFDKPQ
jgi:hypothetical protein